MGALQEEQSRQGKEDPLCRCCGRPAPLCRDWPALLCRDWPAPLCCDWPAPKQASHSKEEQASHGCRRPVPCHWRKYRLSPQTPAHTAAPRSRAACFIQLPLPPQIRGHSLHPPPPSHGKERDHRGKGRWEDGAWGCRMRPQGDLPSCKPSACLPPCPGACLSPRLGYREQGGQTPPTSKLSAYLPTCPPTWAIPNLEEVAGALLELGL